MCRGHLDVFELLNFQLRLWLWAESLPVAFNSLSTSIMQTQVDQQSPDHQYHLRHSSRMKVLMNTKDRRWDNWKEWGSIREKFSFHSSQLLSADNSCISDSCSAFPSTETALTERLPLEIVLTDGCRRISQGWKSHQGNSKGRAEKRTMEGCGCRAKPCY